jgi:basic membrane protein A
MRAQYKGVGTINGEGEYRFMLTAIDGDLHANDGVDRFRIKIWDPATDEMIYDNQMGDQDDADPVTVLGGGSIVIHRPMNPRNTRIGLITDVAGLSDMAWNWLAYQGLLRAEEELGVRVIVYEPATLDDFTAVTQQCAGDGNDLCIGVGFFFNEAFKEVSETNPDTYFAILDWTYESYPDNLRGIQFANDEVGYLAGTLAGLMSGLPSGNNTIGAVGGISIPPVNQFICGYQQGAWDANPDANVLVEFAGTFIDPQLGADIAQGMMDQGADVIFGVGGAPGNGAILHAAQADPAAWAIGVDIDQWITVFGEGGVAGSEFLLSSAMKRLDNAVFYTIEDLLNGAFGSGTVLYTLDERNPDMPGVGLAPFHEAAVPQHVIDALAAAEAGLIDGSIWTGYPCGFDIGPGAAFTIQPDHRWAQGRDWPIDVPITLVIDDDADPENGVLYEAVRWSVPAEWDPEVGEVWFDLNEVEGLAPGLYVSMTDGDTFKDTWIKELYFDAVDPLTDIATGRGPESANAGVYIRTGSGDEFWMETTIEAGGVWTANFHDEFGDPDFTTIVDANIVVWDDDGDETMVHLPNPYIEARPDENRIEGWDWPEGEMVNLTVVYNGGAGNHTDSQVAESPPWEDPRPWVSFELPFDLGPGDVITMSSDGTIKVHTVTELQVTVINEPADTVSGTAAPEAYVEAWVHDTNCWEGVEADGSGNWSANFIDCPDIRPGSQGAAIQPDEDWDVTWIEWGVPNPIIVARPEQSQIEGWDWPVGTEITLSINGALQGSATAEPQEGHPQTVAQFSGITFSAGDSLVLTGGGVTKEHVVTDLQVTGIDEGTDTVSGTATEEAYIDVWPHDTDCGQGVEPDDPPSAFWTVSFYDCHNIEPGSAGAATQYDDDGDQTWIEWQVLEEQSLTIVAWPDSDDIVPVAWPEGGTVTVEVARPTTPDDPYYTGSSGLAYDDFYGGMATYFKLPYDLLPGDIVTMTLGSITKIHVVTNLQIASVDPDLNTVSGTSEGSQVYVWHDATWWSTTTVPVVDGVWLAEMDDFGRGNNGFAMEWDDDGDETRMGWRIPDKTLHVVPYQPEIHGYDWPLGATVTIFVDVDADLDNGWLYTEAQVVIDDPDDCGDPCFDVSQVPELPDGILPGYYVTMRDDETTRVVHVTELVVTGVDIEANTVSGTASEGTEVFVSIHDEGAEGVHRRAVADADTGVWTVNFIVPGTEPWEQGIYDLVEASQGRAIQLETPEYDDGTLAYWWVPYP